MGKNIATFQSKWWNQFGFLVELSNRKWKRAGKILRRSKMMMKGRHRLRQMQLGTLMILERLKIQSVHRSKVLLLKVQRRYRRSIKIYIRGEKQFWVTEVKAWTWITKLNKLRKETIKFLPSKANVKIDQLILKHGEYQKSSQEDSTSW